MEICWAALTNAPNGVTRINTTVCEIALEQIGKYHWGADVVKPENEI